jgi:hypothetical protein
MSKSGKKRFLAFEKSRFYLIFCENIRFYRKKALKKGLFLPYIGSKKK